MQSNTLVTVSALWFISELTCPTSVHMFTFADGWAASHCQIGDLAPMQAVVFDWLDRAVNATDQMPLLGLDPDVVNVVSRRLGHDEVSQQPRRIFHDLAARPTPITGVVEQAMT